MLGGSLVAIALVIAIGSGCFGFGDLTGGETSCDGGCSDVAVDQITVLPDGSGEAGGPCPSTHGSRMVFFQGVCIDALETTKADYVDFLQAELPVKQDGPCAFNTTYVVSDNGESLDSAVHGVDWCDARDYCAWEGKRLCGAFDGGAEISYRAYDAPTLAWEWYRVCSQGGLVRYPYSNSVSDDLIDGACNIDQSDAAFPVAPGSFPECVVTGAGVYDMVGNADEWLNACAEPNDVIDDAGHTVAEAGSVFPNSIYGYCARIGGGFADGPQHPDCTFTPGYARDSTIPGIRCCADPQ